MPESEKKSVFFLFLFLTPPTTSPRRMYSGLRTYTCYWHNDPHSVHTSCTHTGVLPVCSTFGGNMWSVLVEENQVYIKDLWGNTMSDLANHSHSTYRHRESNPGLSGGARALPAEQTGSLISVWFRGQWNLKTDQSEFHCISFMS